MRRNFGIVAMLGLLLPMAPAEAWQGNGTEIRSGAGTLDRIDVVTDGSGGSYIAWADRRSGNFDLYLSHRDGNGSLIGGWTANGNAVSTAAGDQKNPQLLSDGAGGVYVCWQDGRNTSSGFDIFVTRITSGGAPASGWPAGGVAICSAAVGQVLPVLTPTSDGNIAVAWLDLRTPGIPAYYVQKVRPDATTAWTLNGVQGSFIQGMAASVPPSLVSDAAGGVFLGYAAGAATQERGYVQRFTGASGTPLFSVPVQINTGRVAVPPVLVAVGAGDIIAAYAVNSDIKAIRLNGGGALVWSYDVCTAAGEQLAPAIVPDGQGGAFIAWGDRRTNGVTDLFAQHVTAGGQTAAGWTANGKSIASAIAPVSATALRGNGMSFDLASDGGSPAGARLVWGVGVATAGTPGNIFGTGVNSMGTPGVTQAICFDFPNRDQTSPVVANTLSGGVVAWHDTRSAGFVNSGVYAAAAASGTCFATAVPGAVTGGSFNTASCYSLNLSWSAPTSGGPVEEYIVRNDTQGITYPPVPGLSQTLTVPNLQPGTTYSFTVLGRNCFGISGAATTLSATTLQGCPNMPSAVTVTTNPSFPANVYVTWQYVQGAGNPATGLKINVRYLNEPATKYLASQVPAAGSGNTTYGFTIAPYESEIQVIPYVTVNNVQTDYTEGPWISVRTPNTPIVPLADQAYVSAPIGAQEFVPSVSLSWFPGDNARLFDLEFASSPSFDPASPGYQLIPGIGPQANGSFSSPPITGLQSGLTYYSRLNAISTRGEQSGWGPSRSFQLLGFRLLSPITSVTWQYGQTQTIRWAPTGTVKVELFPNPAIVGDHLTGSSILLAAAATGSQLPITVPYLATTQARIQVSRLVSSVTEYSYSPVPFTIAVPPGNGNALKVGLGTVADLQMTPDGLGGSYVTWSDDSNGSNRDIFVARTNASGVLISGWPIDITPGVLGDQLAPRLVADGSGGVYVCWEDRRGGVSNSDIYAIRLNSSGAVVSGWGGAAPAFGGIAVTTAAFNQRWPNLLRASDGALIVGWSDGRAVSLSKVYAQKVSAAGIATWATGGVQVSESGYETSRPSLASDGAGGAYLAYVDASLARGYVQRVRTADGARAWSLSQSEITSFTSTNPENVPVLVNDGGTGVIVAYLQLSGSLPVVSDLVAAHVNASDPFAYWATTICNAAGNQINPSIVSDDAGGAIVAWLDERVPGLRGLYSTRVMAGGVVDPAWPANGRQLAAAVRLSMFEELPALAKNGRGGATYAWAIAPGDILSRGATQCGTPGPVATICVDGLEQNAPVIAATGNGTAAIAWRDARGSGTNTAVFASAVSTPILSAPALGVGSGTEMQLLTWIGPAADVVYGAPTSFEVRSSYAAINDANWGSANPVAAVTANGPAGTPYCAVVSGLTSCTTHHYALRTTYANCSAPSTPVTSVSGKTKCFGSIQLDCIPPAEKSVALRELPLSLAFAQVNLGQSSDRASFELSVSADHEGETVRMVIYDILGRQVRNLLDEPAVTGVRQLEWRFDSNTGARVASGIYFVKVQVGSQVFRKKILAQR